MTGDFDRKDKKESRKAALLIVSVLIVLGLGFVVLIPAMSELVALHFTPGLGLRSAAVIAFFVTVSLFVVFAITAGDGLLGELQFMLGSFFLFFLIFWLMIAWVF